MVPYSIGLEYGPIWVSVSVSDLNQNSGFSRTLLKSRKKICIVIFFQYLKLLIPSCLLFIQIWIGRSDTSSDFPLGNMYSVCIIEQSSIDDFIPTRTRFDNSRMSIEMDGIWILTLLTQGDAFNPNDVAQTDSNFIKLKEKNFQACQR